MEIKEKNGKMGLIDTNNEYIVEPIYDNIERWNRTRYWKDGDLVYIPESYLICKDNKVGIANETGVIAEPIYDEIDNIPKEYVMCIKYEYPAYRAKLNDRYGFIDYNGKHLCKFIYNDAPAPVNSKVEIVYDEENFYVINLETGNTIFKEKESNILYWTNKYDKVCILIDDTYKIIDENGLVVSQIKVSDNLKNYSITYLNNKLLQYGARLIISNDCETEIYGLIDYEGNILSDLIYDDIRVIHNSSCVVCHHQKFVENQGAFDLIDCKGNIVVKKAYIISGKGGKDACGEDDYGLLPPIAYYETEKVYDPNEEKTVPQDIILCDKGI